MGQWVVKYAQVSGTPANTYEMVQCFSAEW